MAAARFDGAIGTKISPTNSVLNVLALGDLLVFSVRRFLLVSLAALSAMFVVPMTASADLFCVGTPTCGGLLIPGTFKDNIQQALDDASTNNETDTVVIGSSPVTYMGPFTYTDPEEITIRGSGATKPRLSGAGGGLAVFRMLGNANSTIENLRIDAPATNSGTALDWEGTASDMEIKYSGANADIRAVLPSGTATLEDSSIEVINTGNPGYGNAVDAGFVTGSGLTLRNVEITGNARGGVSAVAAGVRVGITRSTIAADRSAVSLGGVGTQVVASQSVLQSKQPVPADGIVYVLSGGIFNGDHLTMRGNGTARGVLVDSTSAGATNDSTVTLKNSIISNVTTSGLSAEDGATLTTTYTMLPNSLTTLNTGVATQGVGTVIGSPSFFNAAAGDFRLTAPQTSIDAGDPADVTTLDRAGNPRIVNGDSVASARSDLGAYEYQAAAPAVTISAPAKLGQGVAGSFSATATDSDPGDSISLAWNFGDGTATGANASHAFSTLGTKTVTVTATDQIGRSSTATANVSVVDEIAPALKITGVKLNKKRTALVASVACPATETTCSVSYKFTSSKKLKVGKSKKKIIDLAKSGSTNVAGGKTAKLQLKLNKSALALIAKSSLKTKLLITLTDGAQNKTTKSVTYKAKAGKTGSAKK